MEKIGNMQITDNMKINFLFSKDFYGLYWSGITKS